MKIVINKCYGGFGVSDECAKALGAEIIESPLWGTSQEFPNDKRATDYRTDSRLIELMETKGSEWCSGHYAKLAVVEIPDDVKWEIEEYDGIEWVSEVHRTWG